MRRRSRRRGVGNGRKRRERERGARKSRRREGVARGVVREREMRAELAGSAPARPRSSLLALPAKPSLLTADPALFAGGSARRRASPC